MKDELLKKQLPHLLRRMQRLEEKQEAMFDEIGENTQLIVSLLGKIGFSRYRVEGKYVIYRKKDRNISIKVPNHNLKQT